MSEDLLRRIQAAVAVIHAGLMTCQEAADAFAIDRSALRKRCIRAGFDPREARKARVRRLAIKAYDRRWTLPRAMKPATPRRKKDALKSDATTNT